ncbi:MAG: AAA family ATPase [Acidobacteria bacterium]|nr:AAA family ATPase [Acidobacteriota bacterium]
MLSIVARPQVVSFEQPFLYPSQPFVAVLHEVHRALRQREGLVVVTGAAGTGKTRLCRTLVRGLEPGVCASVVLDPRVTVEDLLLQALTDFGGVSSPGQRAVSVSAASTRYRLMRALAHVLASLVPVWGSAVLVIDEAHDLDPAVLDELRVLLDIETEETPPLQVVLVGLPALAERLRQPALRPLDERVARRCVLRPLPAGEVSAYVEHRLAAGSSDMVVAPSAVRSLATRSRGVPRTLNRLLDRALEIGDERGARYVNRSIVREAARRAHARGSRSSPRRLAARVVCAAAAAVVAAGVGLGLREWASAGVLPPAALPPPAFARLDVAPVMSPSMPIQPLPVVEGGRPADPVPQVEAPVRAARPRLLGVTLVRTRERTSLAFDLTAEPEKAALRALSGSALELEVGPVEGRVGAGQFAPGSGDTMIRLVSIAEHVARDRAVYIRARILLSGAAGGDVRITGRTVYVDLAPAAPRDIEAPALLAAVPGT